MLLLAMMALLYPAIGVEVAIRPHALLHGVKSREERYFLDELALQRRLQRFTGVHASLRKLPGTAGVDPFADENSAFAILQDRRDIETIDNLRRFEHEDEIQDSTPARGGASVPFAIRGLRIRNGATSRASSMSANRIAGDMTKL